MLLIGINFRATLGYVTDGANEIAWLGEAYPTTKGGITAGYASSILDVRDRLNTLDRRLAGVHFKPNDGTQYTFRVDLEKAAQHKIGVAQGDTSGQGYQYLQVKDGTTPLLTLDDINGQLGSKWNDAAGTEYTDVTWPTSQQLVTLTFSGTILNLITGAPTAQANGSPIAHLYIEELFVPAFPPRMAISQRAA